MSWLPDMYNNSDNNNNVNSILDDRDLSLSSSSSSSSSNQQPTNRTPNMHARTLTSLLSKTSTSDDRVKRGDNGDMRMRKSIEELGSIDGSKSDDDDDMSMMISTASSLPSPLCPALIPSSSFTLASFSSPSSSTSSILPLNRDSLLSFDPLASLTPSPSPPSMYDNSDDDAGMQSAAAKAKPSSLTSISSSLLSAAIATKSSPSMYSSDVDSIINVGMDHTVASINCYSSSALSSGTFTTISVSPTPTFVGPHTHAGRLHPHHHQNDADSSMMRTMSADVSSHSTKGEPSLIAFSVPSTPDVADSFSFGRHVAHLSIASPINSAEHSPSLRPDSSISTSAMMSSPLVSLSPTAPALPTVVSFDSVDTMIDRQGVVTHAQHRGSSEVASTPARMHGAGRRRSDASSVEDDHEGRSTTIVDATTPDSATTAESFDALRSMLESFTPSSSLCPSPTPNYPTDASDQSASSSSAANASSSADVATYDSSSSSSYQSDSASTSRGNTPLPPVVSALMAAQKHCGITPGQRLLALNASESARLIFIAGDASGAGKSSVAIGLLHLFLKRGYEASELAYIKPCTQCEDVQIISKYCERMNIAHQGLGPVIFYDGFTSEVIDGKSDSVDARRDKIRAAVSKISIGKKWVLVDGVGYAAVGSVAGVSNAEVAALLHAPMLIVGRPGIGNAIDAANFMLAYAEHHRAHVVGLCWNRIPANEKGHTYAQCKEYVDKYFRHVRSGPPVSTYGHVALVDPKLMPALPVTPIAPISCRLRPSRTDLMFTVGEEIFLKEFLMLMESQFDMELLLRDVNRYYTIINKY